MRRIRVPLGERSYDIHIASNLLGRLGAECRRLKLGRRCAIITDDRVAPLLARQTAASLESAGFDGAVISFKSGESSKNLRVVADCYEQLASHRLERNSFIVALGGGVVGDLAGFVAATYLRGIAFVQVPTTLLAQVDSSVGGKTGVNLKSGKNLVGAFYQPRLVLCDLDTLKSLPERDYRAGLAEVIKYGIIADERFFRWLEQNLPALLKREPKALAKAVARSCEIKAEVVGEDEKEGGRRAILNFGHTIGHAIEAISGYSRFLHGEAISVGQVAAAKLSQQLTSLPAKDAERIQALFNAVGLPTHYRLTAPKRVRLLQAIRLDKKVQDGEVKFVLAERIGRVRTGVRVPDELVNEIMGRK
ncbi:MAG TPA: 3-dehydroquinate synthase [Verrucomicrobiales bacterium]|nr:3-dehydroquinate synthase [Verrucomicrobiales bacterium]